MPGQLRGQLEEARKRREVEQREQERVLAATANGVEVARQRILVVGPCASGKSALVEALRQHGYNAHSAAQEHSHVKTMWLMNNPTHLIFLEVNMENIRQRRSVSWGEDYLEEENRRLAHAREHADIIIDTNRIPLPEVITEAVDYLKSAGVG